MKQPPEPKAPNADLASAEETDARAYRVTLPMFEGPLDLLLHLIQKHELNILEIQIGFVAQKYLEYIRLMEDLSIDIASEYLVMAATLTYIKSRSLLPPDPTQAADEDAQEEEEDPRAELIRKLLEYQKYKHAADNLGQRELLGRDVFARGFAPEHNEDEAPLAPMSLFKLMDAFEGVLKRAKQVQEHQIDFEKVSISDRIGQIVDRLRVSGTLSFVQLFDGDFTRVEMVVTFLALLEMTKLRITRLAQEGPLAPIVVELALGPGELHEFEIQRKLGETPSVMQKIDSWDETRVEIPTSPLVNPPEEAALDEQSLANFELTPEELGEDNEWAQELVWAEGADAAMPAPRDEGDEAADAWTQEPSTPDAVGESEDAVGSDPDAASAEPSPAAETETEAASSEAEAERGNAAPERPEAEPERREAEPAPAEPARRPPEPIEPSAGTLDLPTASQELDQAAETQAAPEEHAASEELTTSKLAPSKSDADERDAET